MRTALTLVCAMPVFAAACTSAGTVEPTPSVPGVPPAPAGFRLDHVGEGRSPMLDRIGNTPRTTPLTTSIAVYVAERVPEAGASELGRDPTSATGPVTARPAMTLTLATYADPSGALAAYNTWFAEFGFMPAAERKALGIGDQAERFDVGWPPLHAAIARAGPRLVLAEAGEDVPADRRGALLEALARSAMTQETP